MFTLELSDSYNIFKCTTASEFASQQSPVMRAVYAKGLGALSVEELGRLLSQLGLDRFVTDFERDNVSVLFTLCQCSVLLCFRS